MPWFLQIAVRQLFPQRRWVSFFGVMAILGVSLGVAVLIVVQSVMSGFGEKLRDSIATGQGDIRVEGRGPIEDWKPLVTSLRELPEVVAAAAYVQGVVMLQFENRPGFPGILGVDPDSETPVFPLEQYLVDGSLGEFDEDAILVGESLARSLGLAAGDFVSVYTPLMLNELQQDELLLPRDLYVAGLIRSNWEEIDANLVVVRLSVMQEMYGYGEGIGGIALRIKDRDEAPVVAEKIEGKIAPDLHAMTWLERNRDFLFVLQLEKSMMFFIMLVILVVAGFAISISLMMSVVRKTREIGLFAAMGASRGGIAAAFGLQGMLIGIVGSITGTGLAFLLLYYRNGIIRAFTEATNSEQALRTYYMFRELPVSYELPEILTTVVFAVLLSTLGGLLPAIRAAAMDPAEALRSE